MSKPISASVFIITFNEEANIASALDRVRLFDEVVLVDSGSTDRTLEIAAAYPNVATCHNEFVGFSEQKAFALSLCKNEWVLNIDADELVTDEFIEAIKTTIVEDKADALESTRTLLRWGKAPKHFAKPERLIRFFRKNSGSYPLRRVHESISIVGNLEKTNATILHCENLTLSQRVAKSNRYSELRALDKIEAGGSASIIAFVFAFPITFIRLYLFKGYCLDGVEGFLTCMNASFYAFMKYAKLWEFRNRKELKPTLNKLLEDKKSDKD
jgi:glycosyltransferase involved in cell wall biosynthesis